MSFLSKDYRSGRDFALLVMRVVFAFVLLYGHGWEKLSVVFSGQDITFMNPIGIGATLSFYLAAFAEGICSMLLIVGLFSRFASIILTVNFIIIVIFHAFIAGDGYQILQLRFLYLAFFFSSIFLGPGRVSLDKLLFK